MAAINFAGTGLALNAKAKTAPEEAAKICGVSIKAGAGTVHGESGNSFIHLEILGLEAVKHPVLPDYASSPISMLELRNRAEDVPSGALDKNPPAKEGDIGSISGLGKFHMLQSS